MQYTTDTQRYLLGMKGANAGWDWDVAGLYIRTELAGLALVSVGLVVVCSQL